MGAPSLSHPLLRIARYAAPSSLGLGGLRLYLIHTLISLRRALPLVIRVPPPKPSLPHYAALRRQGTLRYSTTSTARSCWLSTMRPTRAQARSHADFREL